MLIFHPTQLEDLPKIKLMEAADAQWICPYTEVEHLRCIEDADEQHTSIWEKETSELIGFILLKG